jgi:hypothetical protein
MNAMNQLEEDPYAGLDDSISTYIIRLAKKYGFDWRDVNTTRRVLEKKSQERGGLYVLGCGRLRQERIAEWLGVKLPERKRRVRVTPCLVAKQRRYELVKAVLPACVTERKGSDASTIARLAVAIADETLRIMDGEQTQAP